MLVPVLGLVPVGDHAAADRYMYLPGIGLLIALVWPLWRVVARSVEGRWILAGVATLAMVVLVVLAVTQVGYRRDDLTLWTHVLAVTEDNSEAEFSLAEALAMPGGWKKCSITFGERRSSIQASRTLP